MGDTTAISWCSHTFNPWWGCSRTSRGCQHCYAATLSNRWGFDLWQRQGPRKLMSESYWKRPLAWNRAAERAGVPATVFAASMADVFEIHPREEVNGLLDGARARLWDLIDSTPFLIWMLLSKRIENAAALVPWGRQWPSNVWLGTSVEDAERAEERLPVLASLPAAVRFASCEPLVGGLDLRPWLSGGLDWVITGGESGPGAAAAHPDWFRAIRDHCVEFSVPLHHKQNGMFVADAPVYGAGESEADWDPDALDVGGKGCVVNLDGSVPASWDSHHLEVREVPRAGAWSMRRVARACAAGRLLDGRVWDERPRVMA
ncbi:phage Gp37/Gp68 family protein [Aldersonia sp. NBC_00410]|uniref:DUF5131 family protein n=1 Tax=Aldersonia sp. NBC_00410 TaxID=2975954 RepID=UPI00224DD2ED|nr:DUF5131 family protein [Aldersonia sp. NBC_00410]MCX5046698.1 phage Gp37/Gp68 family protein [Aldersonia sp. NBC_00410]